MSGVRVGSEDFNTVPARSLAEAPSIVTLSEFTAIDEPGAKALLGQEDDALIPEGGDIMVYGDGGSGKTTLTIDVAFHLAAGDDWAGITVERALRILLIENEGPRPLFRRKLRRKQESWAGSPIADRILIHEAPWASIRFDNERERDTLAAIIRRHEIELAIVGPLTRVGMNEAGTLQQVRDFMQLVSEVRQLSGQKVAFVLVHHENKGGQVSGAWEGSGDTLLHVQAQGHGHTRLFIQKARWASNLHGTTLPLNWAPGEGFELSDKPVADDNTILDEILQSALRHPGGSWREIREETSGRERRQAELRDQLLEGGRLVNAGSKGSMRLWHADDPARPMLQTQLAPDPEPPGSHPASAPGETGEMTTGSRLPGIRGAREQGAIPVPPKPEQEGADPEAQTKSLRVVTKSEQEPEREIPY